MSAADPLCQDAAPGAGDGPERTPRTNMFIAATLEWDGEAVAVTVRNLSPTGALIEGALVPVEGSALRLARGALSAVGTIAWSGGRRCGMRIERPLAVAQWLGKPGTAAAAVAPPRTLSDDATTLRALEAKLRAVQARLAASPAFVADHGAEMAELDAIAVVLGRLLEGRR